MPKFTLPHVDIDALTQAVPETVTNAVRDAGYITVGLAVLAVQKIQVRRRELGKSLDLLLTRTSR